MLLSILMKAGRAILEVLVTTGLSTADSAGTVLSVAGNTFRARIALRISTDGHVYLDKGETGDALNYDLDQGFWLTGLVDASAYEVQVTNNAETGDAGTLAGTTGSYLAISTNRDWVWTIDADSAGNAQVDLTFDIREIADTGNSVTYANLTLNAIESL